MRITRQQKEETKERFQKAIDRAKYRFQSEEKAKNNKGYFLEEDIPRLSFEELIQQELVKEDFPGPKYDAMLKEVRKELGQSREDFLPRTEQEQAESKNELPEITTEEFEKELGVDV